MTDEDIREELRIVDKKEDVTVTSWEADFIENVAYRSERPLSESQRERAEEIIEKYGDES